MSPSAEAIIKPELLVWARKSAGLSIEDAAKKAQVKSERLTKWEAGELRPTIKQLRKLSTIYKRPLSVFYLPKPPMAFQAIRDFRRLPGEETYKLSPNLMFEIRKARDRRQIALDLYRLLEEPFPGVKLGVELSDKPENLALKIRELLGISFESQIRWKSLYKAFNQWKKRLEDSGILVFQASKINLEEMRAFSISDSPLPVIVLNVKDTVTGRIFSMLHEFIHILLKKGGLCDLNEEKGLRPPEEQSIEVFCNRVAGTILIPKEHLTNENIVLKKKEYVDWEDAEINQLANRYKVSREVVLRRLLIIGNIKNDFYQKKREEYKKEFGLKKRQEGYVPQYIKVISSSGHHFVRLVLNGYYKEKITSSDVSDFLGIRLKHMPEIESEVMGHPIIF